MYSATSVSQTRRGTEHFNRAQSAEGSFPELSQKLRTRV
eukprot:CAMPEP_0118949654 /NCGR_PEP_ID=MMETSP1169-20130426/50041_1 /TAXON_ID=36882 /ORGANISM="Pyramimonas obovata, Strain CCMP722" /LENGTH=38 /DNA_ID= /DNA_START= /DNA_END= /DNA_ORIENTATION=